MSATCSPLRRGELEAALLKNFGHREFLPLQREAVTAALDGKSTFVNMATGGGKSLCFQLPAIVRPKGLTIVVSPLVALMNDQVAALKKKGIWAERWHSQMSAEEKGQVKLKIASGRLKLLYVSPERLSATNFVREVTARNSISAIAVDEAHCLSLWGHDFRTDYQNIPRIRAALGNPPVIATTATASVTVKNDILKLLGVEDALEFIGEITRPNLNLTSLEFGNQLALDDALIEHLGTINKRQEKVIVYCARISETEALKEKLSLLRMPCATYHGELDGTERTNVEEAFKTGETKILFATKAFGMGIDIPDIRHVIHYGPTESLEDLSQEDGRAGRDGNPAVCTLYYTPFMFRSRFQFLTYGAPKLEYIIPIYTRLQSWIPPGLRSEEKPTIGFYKARYDKYNEDNRSRVSRVNHAAAFSALIDLGLIELGEKSLTFKADPRNITAENFPIKQADLDIRHRGRARRLKVVALYAQTPDQEKAALVEDHFKYNNVASRLADAEVQKPIGVNEATEKIILSALSTQSFGPRFNVTLSNVASEENDDNTTETSSFKLSLYTAKEIALFLESMEVSGFIRQLPIDRSFRWVLTVQGEERLKQLGLALPFPSTTAELITRIHQPSIAHEIGGKVSTFVSDELASVSKDTPGDVSAVFEIFLNERFTARGISVSGLQLCAGYFCCTQNSISRTKIYDYLRSLLPPDSIGVKPNELELLDSRHPLASVIERQQKKASHTGLKKKTL